MSYYFPSVDPIYLLKRKGTDDDPFLFLIDEGNVTKSFYVLKEIPSFNLGIDVFNDKDEKMVETESDTPQANQFRVDYSVGIIYFNSSMDGKKIRAEYHGMGFVNIPTTRILMPGGGDDPIETLQAALNRVDDAINILGEVGDLDFVGEYSSTTEYKKWNFVTYNNKTFVAVQDSVGISPDNSSYWRLVSSGVGFSGIYDENTIYNIGDIVSDEDGKNLYVSRVSDNNSPLSDSSKWDLIITLDNTVENLTSIIDSKIAELNDLKQQLLDGEAQRDINDDERDALVANHIATMELFKQDLQESENKRNDNESDRRSEELLRRQSESNRVSSEANRVLQESTRIAQEEAREQNTQAALSEINTAIGNVADLETNIGQSLGELEVIKDATQYMLDNGEIVLEELEGFVHRGLYDPEVTYYRFNIVEYERSTYMAIQETIENDPTNINYWRPLAYAGKDGTEISIEGLYPDEEGYISLEPLGLARENQLIELQGNIEGDYNLKIGDLSMLRTARKDSIVEAINELKTRIDDLIDVIA